LIAGQVKRKQDLTDTKTLKLLFFSLGKTTAVEKKLHFYQVLKALSKIICVFINL